MLRMSEPTSSWYESTSRAQVSERQSEVLAMANLCQGWVKAIILRTSQSVAPGYMRSALRSCADSSLLQIHLRHTENMALLEKLPTAATDLAAQVASYGNWHPSTCGGLAGKPTRPEKQGSYTLK